MPEAPTIVYLPAAEVISSCLNCGVDYPADQTQCAQCKAPITQFRRCFTCKRLQAPKHQKCLYCGTSLIKTEDEAPPAEALQPAQTASAKKKAQQWRATVVSVAVFTAVVLGGTLLLRWKNGAGDKPTAAVAYTVRAAEMRVSTGRTAAARKQLAAGDEVNLVGTVLDPTGARWFEARIGDESDTGFVAADDVAPPKVLNATSGMDMLKFWIGGLHTGDGATEGAKAVRYACLQFPGKSCDELRWSFAERLRKLAGVSPDAVFATEAKTQYEQLVSGNTEYAAQSQEALRTIAEPSRSGGKRYSDRATETFTISGSGNLRSSRDAREYSIVDRAEVHVKLPSAAELRDGTVIHAPIAREIRMNGKVVVPASAVCGVRLGAAPNDQLAVQLESIDFGNQHYPVVTTPKAISRSSKPSIIVFRLQAPLVLSR